MADEGNDTPSTDELYQGNEDYTVQPIPAEIVNVVRIDQMPRTFGMMDSFVLVAAADAFKVLGSDPRRAEVTIWCTGTDLVLASNQGAAQARQGAILSAGLAVPVHMTAHDELWVRPVSGGVEDAILSVITELWAR
jgi:hypothetical protein